MIIYRITDTDDHSDYREYYLDYVKALDELKQRRELIKNANPIMYDVDICQAQFSVGPSRHIYIESIEVIE